MSNNSNMPTIFVIFGATGDLMQKKIAPAFFHLFENEKLPKFFKVIGFAHRNFSSKGFQDYVSQILTKHGDIETDKEKISAFLKMFSYQRGKFENKTDYQVLAKILRKIEDEWRVCANKIFYIAASPKFYEIIFRQLSVSGLAKPCGPKEGWTRIMVEKPFGKDLKTAKKLDRTLRKLFREEQIYRVDHYLAKEMLQNILAFRFSNNLFEQNWSKELIESIEIKLLESIGVEDRGIFYDGIGALRDVGQNHLLQMLALATMDNPKNFEAGAVRQNRAKILETLKIPSRREIKNFSFRAQYQGYRQIPGINPNSCTETYFKIRAFLQSARWQGVPIIMESGKRMGERRKEITVTFRHPVFCFLCRPGASKHYKNRIIFELEPDEKIIIQFWSKKPGLTMEIEKHVFELPYRKIQKRLQYLEEYTKILFDCIHGDQMLFVSTKEVEAMWRFVDPIIQAWQANVAPLKTYAADTNQALAESEFILPVLPKRGRLKKGIGIVGFGKMGANMARRLLEKGWVVYGFDKDEKNVNLLSKEGVKAVPSLQELVEFLTPPRLVWLMVPAGKTVDNIIFSKEGLPQFLLKGDTIIDGGNSYYKDSIRRAKRLKRLGINFLDAGVSGGPEGARNGAALMIGGEKRIFRQTEELFQDLAVENGYLYAGPSGAGHFTKMIHNGIEYGMMQAIAEGFAVLKKAKYKLNLQEIAHAYNHGSVIESRLIGWLQKAFELHGEDLYRVIGSVSHTGEGAWTVKTARELGVKAKIIEEALRFRLKSEKNPSYAGKILSALREQFGGHKVKEYGESNQTK